MKNIFFCVAVMMFWFVFVGLNAQTAKSVEIKGPIVAPWVKGQLCTHYWLNQERIKNCFAIAAGTVYRVENIPAHIEHIKVTRSFGKKCFITARNKKKCKTVKGKFHLEEPYTLLNLTYDNKKITKDYVIPRPEPQGYFGYPQHYGSAISQPNYRSLPDSMAV